MNVDSAVVHVGEAPPRDNQVDPSPVTGRPVSPTWSRFLLELATSVIFDVVAAHFAAADRRHTRSLLPGSGHAEAYQSWLAVELPVRKYR